MKSKLNKPKLTFKRKELNELVRVVYERAWEESSCTPKGQRNWAHMMINRDEVLKQLKLT